MHCAHPFLLFQGNVYYPNGGWLDITGAFATYDDARAYAVLHTEEYQWYQIVDITTRKLIEAKECRSVLVPEGGTKLQWTDADEITYPWVLLG